MTLDEWHALQAVTPATCNQVGALHDAFACCGFADRDHRLAVAARLAGLGRLDSFACLTMADAGRILGALRNGVLRNPELARIEVETAGRAQIPALKAAVPDAGPCPIPAQHMVPAACPEHRRRPAAPAMDPSVALALAFLVLAVVAPRWLADILRATLGS